MKKFLSLLLVLVLIVSLGVGCSKENKDTGAGNSTPPPAVDNKPEPEKPKVPVTLRETGAKIATLNPHMYENQAESDIMAYIFGCLLASVYDKDTHAMKLIGFHAEDLPTRDSEGIVWTFKVRKDAKWEDGTPITANDYLYTYQMLLDPKLVNVRADLFFSDIEIVNAKAYFEGTVTDFSEVGIKALDEHTLQITLAFPVPEIDFFLTFTGGGALSPVKKDIYEAGMNADRTETNYGTSFETVMSCGPYKMTEWIRDQFNKYEKRQDTPLASIYTVDFVESRVVEDANTNLQLYENGDIDYVGLSGANYDKYAEDPSLVFSTSTSTWSMFVNMASTKNPILQNLDLRKALFYGMDRGSIAKNIIKTGKPAAYVVSSAKIADFETGTFFRDTPQGKAITPPNDGFDMELAKQHFEKAFAANNNTKIVIELQYFDHSENMRRMGEFLEEMYEKNFGSDRIDIVLRATPWLAVYENMENGDYEMGFGAWAGSRFNPWAGMLVYTSGFAMKIDQYKSAEFDELYERTVKGDLIFKKQERLDALAKMEKLILDNVPFVPIYEPATAWLFSERIELATGGDFVPGVGFAILQATFNQ